MSTEDAHLRQLYLQHRPIRVVGRDPVREVLQTLVDRGLRRPVEEPLRLGNVGVRACHVARLGGQLLDLRRDVHRFCNPRDEVLELRGFRPAEVDDLVLGGVQVFGAAEAADDAVNDVRHVRIVAARRPVAIHGDRLIGEELPGKPVDRLVRPLARAVNREEAEAVDGEPIEVVERVRQQLAGAFRGGVRRDRFTHRAPLREGHRVVGAVDRGGRAVDERADAQLLRHLQHRLRAADVRLLVRPRGLDGGAHPGPGRKVDDRVHAAGVQGMQDGIGVADVRLDEREALAGKVLDPLLLDGAGIKRIEVVDGRDAVAVVEETATEVPADEAGPAGDADMHCLYLPRRRCISQALTVEVYPLFHYFTLCKLSYSSTPADLPHFLAFFRIQS